MTVATNINITDAQATPVNHVFVPMGKDPQGVFWFVDQSQESAAGYWRISVKLSHPKAPTQGQSSAERVYRATIGLHEPVLETLSTSASGFTPAPTVAYIPRAFTEYIMSERSSLLQRKNLRKMNGDLQFDDNIVAVIENLMFLS